MEAEIAPVTVRRRTRHTERAYGMRGRKRRIAGYLVVDRLPLRRVHDEDDVVRLHGRLDLLHLVEESLLLQEQ